MTRDIFETVNEICEAYRGAEVGFVLLVGVLDIMNKICLKIIKKINSKRVCNNVRVRPKY